MAKIANVQITNTFDTWRVRTNQTAHRISQFAINESSLYANTLTSNVSFTSKGPGTFQKSITITKNVIASGNGTFNGSRFTAQGNVALGTLGTDWLRVGGGASIQKSANVGKNLIVSGNTSVVGLKANGTLGVTGTYLRTNGTQIYWDAVPPPRQYLQVANANITFATKAANSYVKSILANTNAYIISQAARLDLVNVNLVATNTAIRTLDAQKLQVANAAILYATKISPTTSAILAHTGRATISTNLAVSGNTSTSRLTVSSAFPSTSKTSGALVVGGGLGVAGAFYANSIQSTPIGTTAAANGAFTRLGVGTSAFGSPGEIRATDNITAYYSSDINLKENIVPISNALLKLGILRGVTFDWKESYIDARGGEDGYFVRRNDVGVIAQEVQAVLPEAVAEREDGTLAVKYDRIIPLLIEAIKELRNRVEQLELERK
jgi:hypothetical protein